VYRWGVLNYEEEEISRQQFFGSYKQDEETEEWMLHYPRYYL
jgi:hypothetical protein